MDIITWLLIRTAEWIFYGILGIILILKFQPIFKNIFKTFLYSLSFLCLVIGVWELPLFIFGAETGWTWAFSLVDYMALFPMVCILFKIHFTFGKRELSLFLAWCGIAVISAETQILTVNWQITIGSWLFYTNPNIWDQILSYVFRALTFIFLYQIFRKMDVKMHKKVIV